MKNLNPPKIIFTATWKKLFWINPTLRMNFNFHEKHYSELTSSRTLIWQCVQAKVL